jgi:hypothetical protein
MKNMKNKEESELRQLGQGRKKDSNMGGKDLIPVPDTNRD